MGLLTTNKNTNHAEDVFHFPTSKSLLLIFTRNPELGKCKTRLAASIGNENALEIFKFLVSHTAKIALPVVADKYVYYADAIWENDLWDANIFHKRLQIGNDLGERMKGAFLQGFNDGYEKIIVIGSDLIDITTEAIETAFTTMQTHDFVIGPAQDGGYYLLGMKKMKAQLFENKAWGTDTVLEATLQDLKDEKYIKLPVKNDVDLYEDIKDNEVFQPFLKNIKHA
ncbi:MAG: TIGR04282 family arsenosugar biosynthesis glycosyltransferase [Flavobacteriaceae bacterium]|nr:TIGR04282 family arsenosugar biosynthesis glycosyltransferase [Flavobacteriaceae bacterium]